MPPPDFAGRAGPGRAGGAWWGELMARLLDPRAEWHTSPDLVPYPVPRCLALLSEPKPRARDRGTPQGTAASRPPGPRPGAVRRPPSAM